MNSQKQLFDGFTLTFEISFQSLGHKESEQGILAIQKSIGFSSLRLGLKK